jgi:hypothetical protein
MTIGLLLTVLSLAANAQPAAAERYPCWTVQPGETVAGVVQRLTGRAETQHTPWVQVVDPSRSRIVAKHEYHLIRPGWHVCVANEVLRATTDRAPSGQPSATSVIEPRSTLVTMPGPPATVIPDYPWIVAGVLVAVSVGWVVTRKRRTAKRATLRNMRRFGDTFIREFERPLVRRGSEGHPIRWRQQPSPRRRLLKICLAPTAGRTYPNLTDHRKNLEYDVSRVLRMLRNPAVTIGPPYARGSWVVIPFRFPRSIKEEGVT